MITKFANFFSINKNQIFLFSKGRVALHTVCKALNIGSGDVVLMSGYTCVMVPSAPQFLGARCKYVDIDPETYNLNPALLDSLYTKNTKALIIQHTYGIVQDMEPILAWTKKKGIVLIEDCCHVFGGKYNEKLAGTFGVASFFSGQWNKPFSSGLGGMLVVNDDSLLETVNDIYAESVKPSFKKELLLSFQIFLYNLLVNPTTNSIITRIYRLTSKLGLSAGSSSNDEFYGKMPSDYLSKMADAQVKEGSKNIKNIEVLLEHRKTISKFYRTKLKELGFSGLNDSICLESNILIKYPVRVKNKKEILALALKKGVEIGSWFEIPLHPAGVDMAFFGYTDGMCKESEKACREVINLPTHIDISIKQAERIIDFLQKYGVPV